MDHSALSLQEIVEKHHAALVDDLKTSLDSHMQAARDEVSAKERSQALSDIERAKASSARETRLSTAESLNQSLRRIRQACAETEVLSILLESSAPYSQQAVVLQVENNHARCLGTRGVESHEISFEIESAAAIATVCESRDPIVALVSDKELAPALAGAFAAQDASERKVYLFPVVARQKVVAVVIVCGEPVAAALEMLSEAAGMKFEALEPPLVAPKAPAAEPTASEPKANANPELVQIASAGVPAGAAGSGKESAGSPAWNDLSPEDQRLHLQAQRVARVKVAEMRLYHAEELRSGVAAANIYGALAGEIDRARADFLQTFLSKSPTMVDYLHLEILRSLAHDDDGRLGQDYPGPMV